MRLALKIALGGCIELMLLLAAAGHSYRQEQAERERRLFLLSDIADGKTIGGSLRANGYQIICFDAADLTKAKYAGGDVPGAQNEIMKQLGAEDRCEISNSDSKFDVDTDGRQIYHTPHGTAALWASNY